MEAGSAAQKGARARGRGGACGTGRRGVAAGAAAGAAAAAAAAAWAAEAEVQAAIAEGRARRWCVWEGGRGRRRPHRGQPLAGGALLIGLP